MASIRVPFGSFAEHTIDVTVVPVPGQPVEVRGSRTRIPPGHVPLDRPGKGVRVRPRHILIGCDCCPTFHALGTGTVRHAFAGVVSQFDRGRP
jgi:hypothetical protein